MIKDPFITFKIPHSSRDDWDIIILELELGNDENGDKLFNMLSNCNVTIKNLDIGFEWIDE